MFLLLHQQQGIAKGVEAIAFPDGRRKNKQESAFVGVNLRPSSARAALAHSSQLV
jgi:hypothetical protein